MMSPPDVFPDQTKPYASRRPLRLAYGSTTSSEMTTGRLEVIPTPVGPGTTIGAPVGSGAPAQTSQPGCIG